LIAMRPPCGTRRKRDIVCNLRRNVIGVPPEASSWLEL
jgi:hypothetical protein